MLKKKLGLEAIEKDNIIEAEEFTTSCFKIPSSLIIPDGCKKMGYRVFWGCARLKKVVIPGSVKVICDEAFYWCSIEELTISEGVEKIWGSAFAINYIKELVIPGSVETIGDNAFAHNYLEKVVISEGVGKIMDYAFAGCEKLKKVEIPSSVSIIRGNAFGGCSDAVVVINRSPDEEDLFISSNAFEDCIDVKYAKEKTRN